MQLIVVKGLSERCVWGGVLVLGCIVTVVVALSLGAAEQPPPLDLDDPAVSLYKELIGEAYDPSAPEEPDPDRHIARLAGFLDETEHDLANTLGDAGVTARLQPAPPEVVWGNPPAEANGELLLMDDSDVIGSGFYTVVIHRGTGMADLTLELTEGATTRTLFQRFSSTGDVLTVWGTLTVDGGPPLHGGWIYSVAGGAQEYPNSDPGFHDGVQTMLHVEDGARGLVGAALEAIVGIVTTTISYVVDAFTLYTPPTECDGPSFYDADGQSCDGVEVPCAHMLAEMCESIADLEDVSDTFRQCMKGRCGCGGSSHKRVRFSCDEGGQQYCGPCPPPPPPYGVGGCSLMGSHAWYCRDTTNPCECVEVIFHEMSHGCFAMDLKNDCPYDAYRIGEWFKDEAENRFPQECMESAGG